MPTLENIDGASLVPDIVGNFSRSMQAGTQMREVHNQRQKKVKIDTLRSQIGAGGPQAYTAARELQAIDPQAYAQTVESTRMGYEAMDAENKSRLSNLSMTALELSHAGSPDSQRRMAMAKKSAYQKLGMDTPELDELIGYYDNGDIESAHNFIEYGIGLGEVTGALGVKGGGVTTGTTPLLGTVNGQDVPLSQGNDGRIYYNGQPIDSSQIQNLRQIQQDPNLRQAGAYAQETGTQAAQTQAIQPKELEKGYAAFRQEAPSMVNEYEMAKGQTKDILGVIDNAEKSANFWTTGFVGSLSNAVPGTPAADFASELDIINSNLALDSMQALKEASATGSTGLGATNQAEFQALQSEVAALKQSTSEEAFKKNISRVKTRINRYQANRDKIFERTQSKYKEITGEDLIKKKSAPTKSITRKAKDGSTYMLINNEWVKQ